ncbi:hypothetical protein K440DRAFT_576857 [Wilcoxina mikolae CBS 423.85]|nr:hypothetical protein K440DRAFT_576857 [Wilcoxina mikolae CBS 423.85]
MPAAPGPPPSPSPPSELSSAQNSLLRLSRRHSLPANVALSGLLGFLSQLPDRNDGRDAAAAALSGRRPRVIEHTRSSSVIVTRNSTGSEGAINRHRYGHRHTRSEAYDQPIIVKNYNPGTTAPAPQPIEEEDEMDVQLPSLGDFSFDGILKAVEPQVNAALDGVTELCTKYQETLQTEVENLTNTQTNLHARMKDTDKLAVRVLKSTKARMEQLDSETTGLKGGAAVDSLAEATEATHTLMASIVSTLLAIDEMLPPQDRLSPETSAHRNHYPQLHTLLVSKATELNICFGSGKSHGKRPSTGGFMSPSAGSSSGGGGQFSDAAPKSRGDLPLRRRMSSSSQILLSSAGLDRSSSSRAPPPQLQLKTILPSSELDSAQGSYFPLAPQTATGISLAYSNGKSSSNSGAVPTKRSTGIWGGKPNTSTLAFFPIEEGEGMSNSSMANLISSPPPPPPPTTPGRQSFSWRRSSGSWSGFGGFFGGRSSRGSGEQARDRAEDRLKKVLESTEAAGRAVTSSW